MTAIRAAIYIGRIKSLSFKKGSFRGAAGKPELYQSMMLNLEDNKDNLPEDYISDILDGLPEKQKARFRDRL
jgi:hypothetical protein